jgi:hypothetical protein
VHVYWRLCPWRAWGFWCSWRCSAHRTSWDSSYVTTAASTTREHRATASLVEWAHAGADGEPLASRRSSSTPLLAVLKPNRIIRKCTNANCSSLHLRVFLGLSNPQGQRKTSTISILCDNFGERKAKFNPDTSRTTQMQLFKCIHIP